MNDKTRPQILPWSSAELEAILLDLIAHGTEAPKADFKTDIEAKTPEQKAELLKDIVAIANTYDSNFDDHGFLIYGTQGKVVAGITTTIADPDKLQNHIEQLLKSYITPMPQVYVVGFETAAGLKWGAVVIPPRNNKPHMFFKDFQCQDRKYTRLRGEWFVRHGSTTDPGLPEDLAHITQKQTDLLIEPLRESIRTLQTRVGKIEEQYNSALFKLVERALSPTPEAAENQPEERTVLRSDVSEALGVDLPARIKHKLRTPTDAIADDLFAEAKAIRDYLDSASSGLPWAPQLTNVAESKKVVDELEQRTLPFVLAVATIILNDHKGAYTGALIRAMKLLARTSDVPSGTSYNRIGEAIRYYPLGLVLYTIFICAVAAERGALLKQILDIPLKHRTRNSVSHISNTFFYWYEARALINHAFGQRWCEPLPQRIRQIVTDHVGEMITEFSEPEYFFRGEFVLALTHVDADIADGVEIERQRPVPGLYLYFHEAQEAIAGLLFEAPIWLDTVFKHPTTDVIDGFDRNANKMFAPDCFRSGLYALTAGKLYREALDRRKPK